MSMNFGEAFEALKSGEKCARKGWNGKGMYLEAQIPDEHSKMTQPYLYMVIPNCKEGIRKMPYTPTLIDIFAEDWCIVVGVC